MSDRKILQKKALRLVWIGEIWNLVEFTGSIWLGLQTGSIALLAFGFDSLIELFGGGVLIWRLQKNWSSGAEEDRAESKAQKLVGYTYYVLAAYILVHSLLMLGGYLPSAEGSLYGVLLILASAVVMTTLYFKKTKLAVQLNSPALKAEAKQALYCDLTDLPVIIGVGANALFGWKWADPVVALVLIPFLIKEGKENLEDKCCNLEEAHKALKTEK